MRGARAVVADSPHTIAIDEVQGGGDARGAQDSEEWDDNCTYI